MRTTLAILVTAAVLFCGRLDVCAQAPDTAPLPEEPADQTGVPETDASTLIPDTPGEPSGADPAFELDIPMYEEPLYEELPMPEVEEFVIPENKLGRQMEERIRLFEARTKASTDPELQAKLREADTVKTFPERRLVMFDYYTGLYATMLKMEPELEPLILAEREAAYNTLKQTRIKPSVWPVPEPNFPPPPAPLVEVEVEEEVEVKIDKED